MGAYTNPEIAIDTQSGQYIREMLSSVSNSASEAIKAISKKHEEERKLAQEAEAKEADYINKYSSEVTGIGKGVNNSNNDAYFNDITAVLAPQVNTIYKQEGKNTADSINKVNRLKQASMGKLTSFYTQSGVRSDAALDVLSHDIGTEGGMSNTSYGFSPELKAAWDEENTINKVYQNKGFSKNTMNPGAIFGSDGELLDVQAKFNVTSMDGKNVPLPEITESGLTVYNNNYGGSTRFSLPSTKDAINDMNVRTSIFQKKTDKDKNKGYTEEINIDYIKSISGGFTENSRESGTATTDAKTGNPLTSYKTKTIIPNIKIIASQPEIMELAKAKIEGMQDSPMKLNMWYNSIGYKYDPDFSGDNSMCQNVESAQEALANNEKYAKAFANYYVAQALPKGEYVQTDVNGQPMRTIEKYVAPKQKTVKSGAGGVSGAKNAAFNKKLSAEVTRVKKAGKGTVFGTKFVYDPVEKSFGYYQKSDVSGVSDFIPVDEATIIANVGK
jgi:hypothetical protein